MKQQLLSGKKLEWLVLVLFGIGYIAVSIFHEPWFDEAQAWQIARSSLKNILFTIPHYEGHPALWYLILAIPAKLGVPFEMGLKSIGFFISVASVVVLLFHSQLPRIVRILLPFSFFVFYQYGIIVRPYGLMLLLLLLLGQNFQDRKNHPWRVTILMMLLCTTSAYGIVISGGIALGIVWEVLHEKGIKKFLEEVIIDPRSCSLFALFLLSVLLIMEIIPREDTWVRSMNSSNSFILCLFCTMFTFIGDCLITDNVWFQKDTVLLQASVIPISNLVLASLLGIILFLLIISIGSKQDLKFFILPYCFFSVFSAAIYVGAHHIGIALMILLFWLELEMRSKRQFDIGKKLLDKITKNERDKRLVIHTACFIAMICLVIPLYWSVSASIRDIKLDYSYGRSGTAFLRENHMEKLLTISSYGEGSSENYRKIINHDDYINTYENELPVVICAYLDHNICINLGDGLDEEAYMHHQMASYEKCQRDLTEWANAGIPDVLIGKPELEAIYGTEISINDYSLVAVLDANYIWKNENYQGVVPIYLRSDLLSRYGLESLKEIEYTAIDGLVITEEMKERFYNGETVEDILKPYLNAIFGQMD